MMKANLVLVVDDSEIDQYLAKLMIEDCDAHVEILQAYDGQEALEILNSLEQPPDIIFLDINMPRMNGHEFLEQYDKDNHQTTMVIMLSSSDKEIDKEKALAHACVKKYVTKPISKNQIDELLI